MKRPILLAVALFAAAGAALAADPADAPKKPAKAAAAKKPVHQSRQELQSQAKGLALATETAEAISDAQLEVAKRVNVGKADCEFNQTVDVEPIEGKPGFFKVGFAKSSYTMVPEPTTTGAVRLEDKKAGVMWLQIPSKSMLMNSRIGQRMVDACQHPAQRTASTGSARAAE